MTDPLTLRTSVLFVCNNTGCGFESLLQYEMIRHLRDNAGHRMGSYWVRDDINGTEITVDPQPDPDSGGAT